MEVLSDEEIEKIAEETWEGILGLVNGDKPYCIPVAHVYYNGNLYFLFLREGRKIRCIETNKNACYLIHKISKDFSYSILIEGYVERVSNRDEVEKVLEKFYANVIPNDPFFKGVDLKEVRKICLSDSKTGIYKLIPKEISGFKS